MIVSWMLFALLFSGFVAIAAMALEPFARWSGRPTRWIWVAALGVAVIWPPIAAVAEFAAPARLATLATPRLHDADDVLPTIGVVPDGVALMDRVGAAGAYTSQAVLGLWAMSTLALAFRLLRALRVLRRLQRTAEPRMLDGVAVLLTERLGPAAIGLRAHSVIVPRSVLELEEPLRRLVLRHECEHCAARDPWLLLAAHMALVLVPWNLPLWVIARRLRLALEIDCDARVLASGVDPVRYGRLLLWIAQRQGRLSLAPMLAAPPSHLERRITAMRTRLARPHPLHLAAAGGVLLLALAGACSARAPEAPRAPAAPGGAEGPRRAEAPRSAEAPRAAEVPRIVEKPRAAAPRTAEAPRVVVAAPREQAPRAGEAPVAPEAPRATVAPPAPRGPVPVRTEGPYLESQVEKKASLIVRPPYLGYAPRYPAAMLQAKRSGKVVVQYVVDAAGTADLATFEVLESSDPEFSASVREVIEAIRFSPAQIGGKPVAQVVRHPFWFTTDTAGR